MKRYWCRLCDRPRRQRKWPRDIVNETGALKNRLGTCDRHDSDSKIYSYHGKAPVKSGARG